MAIADKLSALRIKANLIADKTVGLMEINTDVHDGIAVLTGVVENEEQKKTAEALAYDIDGIVEVENEIRVTALEPDEQSVDVETGAHMGYGPAEGNVGQTAFAIGGEYEGPGPGWVTTEQFPGEFTDEEIDGELKERLISQHEIDISGIKIESINQIVHVNGIVDTPDDLNRLQDILLKVRGVMGVDSEVGVRSGEIGTPQ